MGMAPIELAEAEQVPPSDVPPKTTVSVSTNRCRRAASVGRGDNEVAARQRPTKGIKLASGTRLLAPVHSETSAGPSPPPTPAMTAGSESIPQEKHTRIEQQLHGVRVHNQDQRRPVLRSSAASPTARSWQTGANEEMAGPVMRWAAVGMVSLGASRGQASSQGRSAGQGPSQPPHLPPPQRRAQLLCPLRSPSG